MDPHVLWLRRRVLLALPRSIGATAAAGAVGCFVLLTLLAGGVSVGLVPWSLVMGQLVAGASVSWALLTNPLSFGYLRRTARVRRQWRVTKPTVEAGVAADLARHRLTPLATIWDDTIAPSPAFDLFQTSKRTVTVARSRTTGTIALYSRLEDGRVLVTDAVLTAPHRKLVVNLADGDDINALVAAHRRAIDTAAALGLGLHADDGRLVLEALVTEQRVFAQLGPVLGAFVNLTTDRSPQRFLVTVDPGDVFELGLGRGARRDPVGARA